MSKATLTHPPHAGGAPVGQSQNKPPDVTPFRRSQLATRNSPPLPPPSWLLPWTESSIHVFLPLPPCTVIQYVPSFIAEARTIPRAPPSWYEPPSATLTYCTVGNGTHTSFPRPFPDAAAVFWACCPVPRGQKQDRALVDDVHNLVHRLFSWAAIFPPTSCSPFILVLRAPLISLIPLCYLPPKSSLQNRPRS